MSDTYMKFKFLVALFLLLMVVGCAKQGSTQLDTTPTKISNSCGEMKGFICNSNEECKGSSLQASDAKTCCSIKCSQKPAAQDIQVPKFDFGKVDSESSLGNLK